MYWKLYLKGHQFGVSVPSNRACIDKLTESVSLASAPPNETPRAWSSDNVYVSSP